MSLSAPALSTLCRDPLAEGKSTVTTLKGELHAGEVSVRLHEHRWDVGATSDHYDDRHVLVLRQSSTSEGLLLNAKGASGEVTCRLGRLALIPATVRLETFPPSHGGAARTAMYHFPQSTCPGDRLEDVLQGRRLKDSLTLESPKIGSLMQYLASEASEPGFGSTILLETLSKALDVEIARCFAPEQMEKETSSHSGRLTARKLDRVISYINDNIGTALSVQNIAMECDISKTHLNQCFKNATGLSIHQYVINTRIATAKRLLNKDDRSLSRIAASLGFRDSSAFSNAFHKKVGQRPGAFRRDALDKIV